MAESLDTNDIVGNGLKAYEQKMAEKEQQSKARRNRNIKFSLAFIFAAAIIVYIFPSGNKFRFSYELGKPWIYESLTAPGGFPVYKTDAEVNADFNSLLKQYYTPYFSPDSAARASIAKNFAKGSRKAAEKLGADYEDYINNALAKVCQAGIVANTNMDEVERLGIASIKLKRVGKDGEAFYADQPAGQLFTCKTAYEHILKGAPSHFDRKALSAFNINEYLKPTLRFEEELSAKQKEDVRNLVSRTRGMVQDGQKIIDRGEIVNADSYRILNSLKYETEIGNMGAASKTAGAGQCVCVLCILAALFCYFVYFRDRFLTASRIGFVLGLIIGMCALTACVTKMSYEVRVLSVYVIPYALVPIAVSTFFDTRTALFTHLTTVLICSLIAPHEFEFLLLQILIGMICISTLKSFYQRSQLFKSVGIISIVYLSTYLGLTLTHTVGFSENDVITMVSFVVNGVLLLFSYPLIFVFEKTFGFASDITLVELSNTNNPLLRQFSEVAPGSFQHSLQVSNLASDAAEHIGCNSLLARAGALYHDIGKMANAIYFTENQNGFNPHSKLSPFDSVKVITNHVTDGLAIARRYGLPLQLQNFIESHHGKNTVRYFYNTYCNAHPDEEVNISDFSYKGKLPGTKEESVVMICDAVEAASRSLTEYTEERINALVEGIVASQLGDGAFADAPITLKQIEMVKSLLKEKLKNLYHTRIRYPELKKKQA